ncbi:MAG: hypothetical protein LBE12_17930 [Planctomycetaceae bacterium]|jgi:hypothetical protein|nr:hypothetical protein [Planctomycetaceae bacterium]
MPIGVILCSVFAMVLGGCLRMDFWEDRYETTAGNNGLTPKQDVYENG